MINYYFSFSVLMFVMLPFMPESPRYLISRGKNEVTKTLFIFCASNLHTCLA